MLVKFNSLQPTAQYDCFIRIDPSAVQAVMDTYLQGPAGGRITAVYLADREQPVLLKEDAEYVASELDKARGLGNG